MNKKIQVKYTDVRGNELVLSADMVREYISNDPAVSMKEIVMFLQLAKFMQLNPFLKEIYLVKYKGQPAQYIVSYHALLMRAEMHPQYDGLEVKVEGTVPDMKATAIVYRKDRTHPTVVEVYYEEAVKLVMDKNTHHLRPQGPWATMPRWMLRKVAVARALKEAFPGIVGSAAVGVTDSTEPAAQVSPPEPPEQRSEEEVRQAADELYGCDDGDDKENKPVLFQEPPKTQTATPQQRNIIAILLAKVKDNKKVQYIRKEVQDKSLTKGRAGKIIQELQKLTSGS